MSNLDYLLPYKKNIDWPELEKLKAERESWWQRESSKKWKIDEYPSYEEVKTHYDSDWVRIEGSPESPQSKIDLEEKAKQLIPWKKGPFHLFDLKIDAEWRSDMKWERMIPFLPDLKNKTILDVGCNNGYFLFRMANYEPRLALGIDPVLPMQAQFDLIQNYAKNDAIKFELFGVEHLPLFKKMFDVIFHMGIVYHHRHPIQQFLDIRESLVPGGVAFLETIGIPGEESYALFPEDRYARMGNVWFIPTMSCFINWAKKARFINVEIVSDTLLTSEEQRKTPWCPPPFQSLNDSLDPEDSTKTIEGHPAPRRFLIKVQKKKGN